MTMRIEGQALSLKQLHDFLRGERVALGKGVKKKLVRGRRFVEKALQAEKPTYGINTGFGLLAAERISPENLARLQENLIISHAVGVGSPFPAPIARLIMLLRANVLAKGYSGIRVETLSLLLEMLNQDLIPLIPHKGSVGASGDLAPLAHLALTLIGRGEVMYQGEELPTQVAMERAGLSPVTLQAKEGIALINGTQAITAMGVLALIKLENLLRAADVIGALSVEGDRASKRPFDARIQALRPHPGQISTAQNIRTMIAESSIIASHAECTRVQDAYSFRCIPQVHGAVKDAIAYARDTILRETGACTDNPIIFVEEGEILSGGNFHGEPLAFAMDTLGMAVAELGSISERRVAILTAPLADEIGTKFLTREAGLNSGLMIPHVTMSALVSENKLLTHPASSDSIPTSGGQEDHVSMGTFAAQKALTIIENVEQILAIELFAASQAVEFQLNSGAPGRGTRAALALVRRHLPPIAGDREFRHDIESCVKLLRTGELVSEVTQAVGELLI